MWHLLSQKQHHVSKHTVTKQQGRHMIRESRQRATPLATHILTWIAGHALGTLLVGPSLQFKLNHERMVPLPPKPVAVAVIGAETSGDYASFDPQVTGDRSRAVDLHVVGRSLSRREARSLGCDGRRSFSKLCLRDARRGSRDTGSLQHGRLFTAHVHEYGLVKTCHGFQAARSPTARSRSGGIEPGAWIGDLDFRIG